MLCYVNFTSIKKIRANYPYSRPSTAVGRPSSLSLLTFRTSLRGLSPFYRHWDIQQPASWPGLYGGKFGNWIWIFTLRHGTFWELHLPTWYGPQASRESSLGRQSESPAPFKWHKLLGAPMCRGVPVHVSMCGCVREWRSCLCSPPSVTMTTDWLISF